MSSRRGIVLMEVLGMLTLFAVAGVVFPLLSETRKAANEAAALDTLRTIATAQDRFHDRTGTFADSLATLTSEGLIVHTILGSGVKQGYVFHIGTADDLGWGASGSPGAINRTGDRYFFVDESGVIRITPECPPGQTWDPVLGQCVARDTHLRLVTVAAIREADDLSTGLALPMARTLVATPGVMPFVLAQMDADGDGRLTFGEVLGADVMAIVTALQRHLGGRQGGQPIAPDRAFIDIADRYLAAVRADLALGVADEVDLPAVAIRDISGDPAALLDLAAGGEGSRP